MLSLVCSDGGVWIVPEDLVKKSHVLSQASAIWMTDDPVLAEKFCFSSGDCQALEFVIDGWFGNAWRKKTPLQHLVGARRLFDYLGLECPEHLIIFLDSVTLETVRASGVENLYNYGAARILTAELHRTWPEYFFRAIPAQVIEGMYWKCLTSDIDLQEVIDGVCGAENGSNILSTMHC
jgi:hypothetical protein